MLASFSDEALTIPRATDLYIAEGIAEILVDKINARSEASMTEPPKQPSKGKKETLYNKLLQGKLGHLSTKETA